MCQEIGRKLAGINFVLTVSQGKLLFHAQISNNLCYSRIHKSNISIINYNHVSIKNITVTQARLIASKKTKTKKTTRIVNSVELIAININIFTVEFITHLFEMFHKWPQLYKQ